MFEKLYNIKWKKIGIIGLALLIAFPLSIPIFTQIMLWGKSEGYKWFNMGMAPLSGLENRHLAPLWNRVGTYIFKHGEHFYNFQGLRQYKDKFNPEWKPKYLVCPGGLALPRILANIASITSGGIKGIIVK